MFKSLILHLCVLTFIVSTPLGAQEPLVLYSTFGPGDTYNRGAGAGASGPDAPPGYYTSGFPFVSPIAATLDTIQAPFGGMRATTAKTAFTLSVRAANGRDGGPGDVLETFVIPELEGLFAYPNPLLTLRSTSRPLLNAGTVYWLVATAEGDNWVGWNVNNINLRSRFYSAQLYRDREFLLDDALQAAFRINGIPVIDSDADDDGVPDTVDRCPNTPAGAIVDVHGCSIEQLVPCNGPWRNHGQYVSAVIRSAHAFGAAGLITAEQQYDIINAAARSNCGKPRSLPVTRENSIGGRVFSPPAPNGPLRWRR